MSSPGELKKSGVMELWLQECRNYWHLLNQANKADTDTVYQPFVVQKDCIDKSESHTRDATML